MRRLPVSQAVVLPAAFPAVYSARVMLSALLDDHGWPFDDASAAVLALSEAVSNAVEHGSEDGGEIHLTILLARERLEVAVRDFGRPVDAPAPPPVDAGPARPPEARGRGLVMMQRLAGALSREPALDGGTVMRLSFPAPVAVPAPTPRAG